MPRLRHLLAAAVVVAGGLAAPSPPTSGATGATGAEGACTGGHVEVRGRVTDAATGLRLAEVTSVEYEPSGVSPGGTPADGDATNANSFYSVCLLPGTYQFTYRADSYRVDQAAGLEIDVIGPGPIVRNIALNPRGRVIAGRVTNMRGVPKFASIGIWQRQASGRWHSLDGIGNHEATGWYSYRVPTAGRYRVSACVDFHTCQWATSASRLRHARTVIVGHSTMFINDVHVRVPYCHAAPDFCVPPGFNS
jgi:hypothetical protein